MRSSSIFQTVMTASLCNVAFKVCVEGGRPPRHHQPPPPLCTLSVTLTPTRHQSRQTQSVSARPPRRGSPSPRRVLLPLTPLLPRFPRPQDFPPSNCLALHNRKSLYNQQHTTALKKRVLLWQPSPLRMANGVGVALSSEKISRS